jgi:hypothetical protein
MSEVTEVKTQAVAAVAPVVSTVEADVKAEVSKVKAFFTNPVVTHVAAALVAAVAGHLL